MKSLQEWKGDNPNSPIHEYYIYLEVAKQKTKQSETSAYFDSKEIEEQSDDLANDFSLKDLEVLEDELEDIRVEETNNSTSQPISLPTQKVEHTAIGSIVTMLSIIFILLWFLTIKGNIAENSSTLKDMMKDTISKYSMFTFLISGFAYYKHYHT